MDNIRRCAGHGNIKLTYLGTALLVAFWYFHLPFIIDVLGFICCFCIGVLSVVKIIWFRNRHAAYMARHCRKHHLWIGLLLTLSLAIFFIWLQLILVLPAPETTSSLPSSLRRLRKDSTTTVAFAETELSYLHGAGAASAYTCLVAACRVPGTSSINRTWTSIQERLMQQGSPSLGLTMTQSETGCWQQDSNPSQNAIPSAADLSEASVFEDFRHDTLILANDLATYAIKVIKLESAIDTTINQTILESINDIYRLLSSTRTSTTTTSSSVYTISLDRLIAFYSSSSLSFWPRLFHQKSFPLYTHLRPYLFPTPTPTESLSQTLLSLNEKVTTCYKIHIALANVREAYSEASAKLTNLINDYGTNENIPVEITRQFPPIANLVAQIRNGSTSRLGGGVSVFDAKRRVSGRNWWGNFLEEVIFEKIWGELERMGRDVEEMRITGRWIEGRVCERLDMRVRDGMGWDRMEGMGWFSEKKGLGGGREVAERITNVWLLISIGRNQLGCSCTEKQDLPEWFTLYHLVLRKPSTRKSALRLTCNLHTSKYTYITQHHCLIAWVRLLGIAYYVMMSTISERLTPADDNNNTGGEKLEDGSSTETTYQGGPFRVGLPGGTHQVGHNRAACLEPHSSDPAQKCCGCYKELQTASECSTMQIHAVFKAIRVYAALGEEAADKEVDVDTEPDSHRVASWSFVPKHKGLQEVPKL
ncbi:uncharacterized protein MYCFIDRAFT_180130 [Pseudocercospora fijiensis CIRAD86]|uniref:Uncharacterized protein n=1 Tax=Pseudocercospora fijiensis (strain CIRAD86) TaxID=383855 RepID=M3AIW1_PSEFD|nr:uncharacterized protein MYCFIDRAFT_180130 [Pseudocercospora fijiensis CIRAD86]EME77128.1 hypothetical protein MYCFIDRAFT_180130 [Pseudocercospora fijiensis CIRAD86]